MKTLEEIFFEEEIVNDYSREIIMVLKAEVEDGLRSELIRVDLGFILKNLIEIFLLFVILVKKLHDAAKSVCERRFW